jgi:hypothetical protein
MLQAFTGPRVYPWVRNLTRTFTPTDIRGYRITRTRKEITYQYVHFNMNNNIEIL